MVDTAVYGKVEIRRILKSNPLLLFLTFAIPFIVYSGCIGGDFVYDDNVFILQNPLVRDISRIPDVFTSSVTTFVNKSPANYYRPVYYLVYMFEYRVFGANPMGWHIVNLILHSMNAVMVFLLALFFMGRGPKEEKAVGDNAPLRRAGAFFAALVFALHPINSEVVSWVAAVPELVYTLFLLISFHLYIRAEEVEQKRTPLYVFSVFCFFLALLAKETAMALIIIIPLYEMTMRGRGFLRRWKVMLPYFLTASLYMFLRTYALGGVMQMKQVELTRYDAVINVFPLIARYTGKLLLPVNLSAVYSYDIAHSITEPGVIVGLLTASAIIAVLFLLRKKTRVFLFLCWIFVPLLPVLYMPAVSVGGFADRYLYLSTAGFGVILGVAALRILSRAVKGGDLRGEKSRKTTIAVTATAAGLLIIYSIASVERSRVWRNDYSLWSDAVIKSPGSAGAYNNLGFAQTERGEVDEAIKSLRRAIELNRDSPGAYNNLGVALFHRKRYAEAMKNYRRAAELNPDNAEALSNIAEVLVILDRPEEALGYVNKALELSPGFADGHRVLGTAYAKLGRSRQAVEEFTVAIRINPDFAEAYNDLGETFLTMGRDEDAARAFEEAVRIDPSNGEFRKNLARAGRPGGLSVP